MSEKQEDNERTTIVLLKKTKSLLDDVKIHPRESYEEVIVRLLNNKEKIGG